MGSEISEKDEYINRIIKSRTPYGFLIYPFSINKSKEVTTLIRFVRRPA